MRKFAIVQIETGRSSEAAQRAGIRPGFCTDNQSKAPLAEAIGLIAFVLTGRGTASLTALALGGRLPPLRPGDPAEHQRQRDRLIPAEGLAQHDDGEHRAEHRHQIDENPRPAWPDQFNAAHIE